MLFFRGPRVSSQLALGRHWRSGIEPQGSKEARERYICIALFLAFVNRMKGFGSAVAGEPQSCGNP